jgi:hypothetical protein
MLYGHEWLDSRANTVACSWEFILNVAQCSGIAEYQLCGPSVAELTWLTSGPGFHPNGVLVKVQLLSFLFGVHDLAGCHWGWMWSKSPKN